MTKIAAAENESSVDQAPMDPNTIIVLDIVDRANAGRNPSTRWGRTQFDDAGRATIKVPLKDVTTVHSLRWLSVDDQEKYLGISQEAAIVATTSEVAELQNQLDATKNACTRLAQTNATLEVRMDEMLSKYQKEYSAYQDMIKAQLEDMQRQIHDRDIKIDVLTNENNLLQEQVTSLREAPTQPIPSVPPSGGKQPDVSAKKSGK